MAQNPPDAQNGVETDATIPVVETDFAELRDGSLVEMIEDPANPTRSLLAVYKKGSVECVEQFRDGDRVLVPPARTDLLLRHIRLPQGAEPYGTLRALLGYVLLLLRFCLDIEIGSQVLITAYVLSTWFPEKLPFAPYLALLGPPGSGKTTALRILALLCRRSLSTTDISSAAFYEVCHRMSPTILIDETRTAGDLRTLLHLLKSSSAPGFVALRKDKAQMAYGPKVFSWVELPNDPMLNSRCIIIPMHRTRRADLRSPDDRQVIQCAERARRCLLQFRLEHFNNLAVPKTPADVQLTSRPLDLYRALALPVGEDQDWCNELAHLVAAQRQFQPSLLLPAQASALRNLQNSIHEDPKDCRVRLSGLTTAMKCDLASRGEPSGLNERKVGDLLTALGFTNRTRTNVGYVLWLYRSDRLRIHNMVRDYDVDGTGPNQNCDICKEIGTASPASGTPRVAAEIQARTDEPKHEHHERSERRERGPGGATRAANRRAKQLRSR